MANGTITSSQTTNNDSGNLLLSAHLEYSSPPPIGEAQIVASHGTVPLGIRDGQTLIVDNGGVVESSFIAGPGSTVLVQEGGILGSELEAVGAVVTISGGTVGDTDHSLWALGASEVTTSGGRVDSAVHVGARSQATVSGGTVWFAETLGGGVFRMEGGVIINGILANGAEQGRGQVVVVDGHLSSIEVGQYGELMMTGGDADRVENDRGGRITISGGGLGGRSATRSVNNFGELNIYGGSISEYFITQAGSEVRLLGTGFSLGGEPVTALTLGEAFEIEARDVQFAGILADGSPFRFDLASFSDFPHGYPSFHSEATVTITLVSLLKGDYNSNGTVEQADLDLVLLNWGEELFDPYGAGWLNDLPSGLVDQEELDKVLLGWGNPAAHVQPTGAAGVPEPKAMALALLAFNVFLLCSRWSTHRQ